MSYKHPDTITYWLKTDPDRFGNPNWSSPSTAKVRWEDGARLVLTNTGREIKGSSTIFTQSDFLNIGDQIYLGKSTENSPVVGSFEILQKEIIKNLRGTKVIYSYIL